LKAEGGCGILWAGLGIEKKRAKANFKIYSAPHLADKIIRVHMITEIITIKGSISLRCSHQLSTWKLPGICLFESTVKAGLTMFAVRRPVISK